MGRLISISVAVAVCAVVVHGATKPADLNGDHIVNLPDYVLLARDWLRNDVNDITGDRTTNWQDLGLMAADWLWSDVSEDMVWLPGGTFQMGDSFGEGWPIELPIHTITLNSFYISSTEVTNGQYCQHLNSALGQGLITVTSGVVYKAGSGTSYPYCDTSSSSSDSQISHSEVAFAVRTKGGRDMSGDPMVMVSWYGAAAYCNWLSQQEGRQQCYNLSTWDCDFSKNGYHLPTEAQWEYAARGGWSGRRFPWGNTITHNHANYNSITLYTYDLSPTRGYHPEYIDGIFPYTSPVGSFSPNSYGIYDMAGNAWEWCNDWYGAYGNGPLINPTGPADGYDRIIRGGGWSDNADRCRVANRDYVEPYIQYSMFGFRISLDLD